MGETAPATTMPDNIDNLARTVRESGLGEDSALSNAVRGLNNANEGLTRLSQGFMDLFKGRSRGGDDDADDGDDDDDDDADDEPSGVGFHMNKGRNDPGLFDDRPDPSDGPADATEFMLDLAKSSTLMLDELRALRAENAEIRAENAEMRSTTEVLYKSQAHLARMIEHLGGVIHEGQATMVKAVAESTGRLAQLPAPAKTPAFPARPPAQTPAELPETSDYIGGNERIERKILMKAVNDNQITPIAESMFRTKRKFSDDPNEHAAALVRVHALLSTTKVTA